MIHATPGPAVYELLKLLHLIAAIVWMGGMTFMIFALRPAALATLEPQPRARLMVAVWQRFFAAVLGAIVVLLLSGGHLYAGASRTLGVHLMMGLGLLMFAVFGHIYFAGFRKFKRAVLASDWPLAARAAGLIQQLVMLNFVLGWLAIAAVRLIH